MSPDLPLTVGTEIEYPKVQPDEDSTTFKRPAYFSGDVRDSVRSDYGRHGWPDGEAGSDPTAGLELRSDPMSPAELRDWYRMSIAELTKYAPHEPTGISANSTANTIGLHLHVSPLSVRTAEALFEMSEQPWFRIFACSSIVDGEGRTTFQLFRDNYCQMRFDPEPRSSNDCVTLVNEADQHWEWRLLEPVTPDHFDLVIDFIELLKESPNEAEAFARELVDNADPRLTAVKRAEQIGIADRLSHEGDLRTNDVEIQRSHHADTFAFYEDVRSDSHMPYIYLVDFEGEPYYAMYSENYGEGNDPFRADGVTFNHDSVLRADSLEEITGDTAQQIREHVHRDRNQVDHSDSPTKTEATDVLVDKLSTSRQALQNTGGDVNV